MRREEDRLHHRLGPISDGTDDAGTDDFAHTLYVANTGSLVSYDLATGQEKPGQVTDVNGPTDLQVLDDGRLVVNLSDNNEVLFVDGTTMLEITRVASTLSTGSPEPSTRSITEREKPTPSAPWPSSRVTSIRSVPSVGSTTTAPRSASVSSITASTTCCSNLCRSSSRASRR